MTDFTQIPWDNITSIGQKSMLDDNVFNISWILGRFCNYQCSYCWPYANSQTPDYQELSIYIETIQEIKRQANVNGFDKFHWSFSGGEPTAYKHLMVLLHEINGDSIHLTTNLSPGIKWWQKYLRETKDSKRRSITASYHAEFANEEEFIEKCIYLMNQGVFVTVNQVMVPGQFHELYNRCVRMSDMGINVTLKPQSNETANSIVPGYEDDMVEMMQKGFPQQLNGTELLNVRLTDKEKKVWYIDQAERLNSFGFNKFQDWTCNSGFQSVIIKGTEVKRSYSCKDYNLGNILTGFGLFVKPQPCITPICVSSADSKIPKYK